jgi:Uncharacterised nucleotidyltransferase
MSRSSSTTELWRAVDRLIDHADLDGILAHKLGPLASIRWRDVERQAPEALAAEERAASFSMLCALPLLRRIREVSDGPLLLLKGPEIAALYPQGGRRFGDVDILTPDAATLQRALADDGFVEADEYELDHAEHHHLAPLRWPVIPLNVEVHALPNWPDRIQPPPLGAILEAAVPSTTRVEGLSAPHPLHHALMLAAHAWKHAPLETLRDLVDVAALAAGQDAGELAETAERWGIRRIWETTRRAVDALFFASPRPASLRVWARHLESVRERTVFEDHLQRWLHAFWGLPLAPALAETGRVLRAEVAPGAGETWRDKLRRIPRAVRDAGVPLSDRAGRADLRRR